MNKLNMIALRGLSGSGKTTYAKEFVKDNPEYVRVNRDDLRSCLFGNTPYEQIDESLVTKAQDALIKCTLDQGKSVIIDNTNLRPEYLKHFMGIASLYGASFFIQDFDVPLEECLARDKRRERAVGEEVIHKQHKTLEKYKNRIYNQYQFDKLSHPHIDAIWPAVIFDLDGTLALLGDRDIYDGSKVYKDTVNKWVLDILNIHSKAGQFIILCSGREEKYRDITERWLKDNDIRYDELFMRKEKDYRDDSIVKYELYKDMIYPRFDVLAVYDDRDRVVKMWRQIGLNVAQVNYGDF